MFPTRNETFLTYCEPAQARCEIWRTLLGILLIAGVSSAVTLGLGYGVLKLGEFYQLGLGYSLAFELLTISSKRAVLIALFSVILMLPALWLVLKFLHKRSLRSLIAPTGKVHWKSYWVTAIVITIFGLLTTVPAFWAGETHQQQVLTEWLPWVIPALLILMIQTATEELIFRGYLLQQLAARFRSRWVWLVLPSLLFGAMHYNPTVFGSNAWLVVVTATLTGIILADITVRFGSLSIAMGLHFANNLLVALLIGTPGHMSSLSLFVTELNLRDEVATQTSLLISLGMTMLAYLIYLLVMRRRR